VRMQMTTSVQCPNGHSIRPSASFCTVCGASLARGAEPPQQGSVDTAQPAAPHGLRRLKGRWMVLGASVAVAMAGGTVAAMALVSKSHMPPLHTARRTAHRIRTTEVARTTSPTIAPPPTAAPTTSVATSTRPSTVTTPAHYAPGQTCPLGIGVPDCIDPGASGAGVYLIHGDQCMALSGPVTPNPPHEGPCTDFDSDGVAGVAGTPYGPPVPPSTSIRASINQYQMARASIPADKYGIVDDKGYGFDPHADLQAIPAFQSQASGEGAVIYLFHNGRLLGTDATTSSIHAGVSSAGRETIAVEYELFRPSDPFCCPSKKATVRFQWDGSAVRPLDPLPPTEGPLHR